jgi:hypothetical protein
MKPSKDWQVLQIDDEYHVLPNNDTHNHSYLMTCHCHPRRDAEDEAVIVHNSFDGRELIEDQVLQ